MFTWIIKVNEWMKNMKNIRNILEDWRVTHVLIDRFACDYIYENYVLFK